LSLSWSTTRWATSIVTFLALDGNVFNLTYNLGGMLNKIWFVAAIWHAAKQETAANAKNALLALIK